MAHRPSHSEKPPAPPPPSWARWSSIVRLAVWGGPARCASCGSPHVRRSSQTRPGWTRALGLASCRCEACLTVFDVPRRAAPPPDPELEAEPEPTLELPPPPAVDLTALDREMARHLKRLPQEE